MKIAVCVPVHRNVPVTFFKSFSELLAYSVWRRHEIYLLIEDAGSLEMKRNRLAIRARASGADHLLWMDDDQTFPPDALERLLSHNLPVVGCNYVTRDEPPLPTALDKQRRVYTTEQLAKAGSVHEVRALGLGLCLMKTSVLDALDKWAQSRGGQMAWPLFDSRVDHLGNVSTGEDVFFFSLLNRAGIPIFVDHALSWEVGHLSQTVQLNSQAEDEDADSAVPAAGDQHRR